MDLRCGPTDKLQSCSEKMINPTAGKCIGVKQQIMQMISMMILTPVSVSTEYIPNTSALFFSKFKISEAHCAELIFTCGKMWPRIALLRLWLCSDHSPVSREVMQKVRWWRFGWWVCVSDFHTGDRISRHT